MLCVFLLLLVFSSLLSSLCLPSIHSLCIFSVCFCFHALYVLMCLCFFFGETIFISCSHEKYSRFLPILFVLWAESTATIVQMKINCERWAWTMNKFKIGSGDRKRDGKCCWSLRMNEQVLKVFCRSCSHIIIICTLPVRSNSIQTLTNTSAYGTQGARNRR